MTKQEFEMAMIETGKQFKAMMEKYNPKVNHMSVYVVDGIICVSACEWDSDAEDYIQARVLDAAAYPDGAMRLGDTWIRPTQPEEA